MSENVICEITDHSCCHNNNNMHIHIENLYNDIINDFDEKDTSRFDVLYVHYNINYTIKMLGHILEYY